MLNRDAAAMSANSDCEIVKLNVGGHHYTTTVTTLTSKYPKSKLAMSIQTFITKKLANNQLIPIMLDSQGKLFIDRDGTTFRYILDYLRREKFTADWIVKMVPVPEHQRLRAEAIYYEFPELVKEIDLREIGPVLLRTNSALIKETKTYGKPQTPITNNISPAKRPSNGPLACGDPYFISVGYRGYYTADRDSPSNDLAKFRRITRITVSGRSDVAKEVFHDHLNVSRDPERSPQEGYTSRYYLTHNYLEQAFETLAKRGFELVSTYSTGNQTLPATNKDFKQWSTFVEYLFYRKPTN